jgi:hypothetical protein
MEFMSMINFSYRLEEPKDTHFGVLYIKANIPVNDDKMSAELSKASKYVQDLLKETIAFTFIDKTTNDGMDTWTLEIILGGKEVPADIRKIFCKARDIIRDNEAEIIKKFNLKKM